MINKILDRDRTSILNNFESVNKIKSLEIYDIEATLIKSVTKKVYDLIIDFKDEKQANIENYFLNHQADYITTINKQGIKSIVQFGELKEDQATQIFNIVNERSIREQPSKQDLDLEHYSEPEITSKEQNLMTTSESAVAISEVSNVTVLRLRIDITAPIVSYEIIDNQLFIRSNESVNIVIKDDKGVVIGQGSIQDSNSTVINLFIDPQMTYLAIAVTDLSGNTANFVEQLSDQTAPVLQDYYIDELGNIILTFNEKLDENNFIEDSLFNIQINGLNVPIKSISVNGSTVTVVLDNPVYIDQQVSLIYTDLTPNNDANVIQDVAGNDALDFYLENIPNQSSLQPTGVAQPNDILFYDDVENGLNEDALPLIEEIPFLSITNDSKPTIEGKGIAAHTILIYIDGIYALSTTVSENGIWKVESPFLEDGLHRFSFIQQNPSGQQSSTTDDFIFTVDTQVDSVESSTPATHEIVEVEGNDFVVSNNEVEDQLLTIKGQISGLYPGDIITEILVEMTLANSGQKLSITLSPDAIDANGIWTAQFPLDGVELVNGNAQVIAFAKIKDGAGNSASLNSLEQPFVISLNYAQEDRGEVNFDTINSNYTLDTVNSTQFLNVLDISDRLNTRLENGTTISITQPTEVATFGRSTLISPSNVQTSDVVGKVVVSYADLSLLTVAKSYGVVLQKLDENGQWQYHMAAPLNKEGVVASLGTQYALGAVDSQGDRTLTFDGLSAGEYRVSTYVVPSDLTQFLEDFELSNLGAEGTLIGQQNQDFLLNAVSKALGADSPSTQQLISIIESLIKGLNAVTLPISFILDRLLDQPLLRDVLQSLDKMVDAVVAPLVTNTLELLRNLEIDISYSESYVITTPIIGNVLENDFDDEANLDLSQVRVFDGYQYQTIQIEGDGFTTVQGQYGTLNISSNGSYTYTAFASSKNVNATEFFKYTVRQNFNQNSTEQEVEFKIKINGQDQFNLTAIDDESFIDLVVEPTVVEQELQSVSAGGLAYIGLGSVLDLKAIQLKNVLQFDIAHDTQREIHFQAESGGVQILTDFDLFIYKWNAEFQQYELYKQHSNWFGVALLGGVSDETSYTLDSGQYIAMLEPTRGVNALYGYTLKTTQDLLLDYTDPVAVYGQATGNVIHDINQTVGGKDYSPNTELLYLTALNGQTIFQDQLNTGLSIDGQFGRLEIFANGDYIFTAYDEKSFNYGDKESFVYTVYDPILNQSKNATLTITLDLAHFSPEMDTVNVDLSIEPSEMYYADLSAPNTVTNGKKSTTGFGVVGIGLGPVVSADIISTKPGLSISVKQGELVSMQLSATGTSVVGVGNVSDLVIYKKNSVTGAYELYHSSENFLTVPLALLGIPLGGIYNKPEQIMFSEGDYIVYLTTNGVSVIGGNTLTADHMTVYDYNDVNDYAGQLQGMLDLSDHLVLTAINDQTVDQQNIQIVGKYGTLSVSPNGQYSYEVNNSIQPPQYGKMDTFSYVTTNSLTGQSQVSILNIKLSTIDAQADLINEQGELLSVSTSLTNKFNQDAVVFESTSALSKSNKIQATSLDKLVKTIQFDIDTDSESKGLKLNFEGLADVSSARIDLSYRLVLVKNNLGQTVNTVISSNTISQIAQAKLALELHDLAEGQYELQLNMPGNAGSLRYYGYEVKVFNQYADQWVNDPSVEDQTIGGNLLSNDLTNKDLINHTILKINNKTVVLDPSKTDTEITVTGQYGVLTVKSDGDYSYKANGQGGGKEIFVYELISPTGDSDKSTLEINVSKNVMGSSKEDVVESGSADDVYFLSEGSDTLIFNLLSAKDATGGNGSDVWKDFGNTDKIDISSLLTQGLNSMLKDFVSVDTIDGNTVISIDRDGQSYDQNNNLIKDKFEFTHLLTLEAKDLSLDQLLQNNQIIF